MFCAFSEINLPKTIEVKSKTPNEKIYILFPSFSDLLHRLYY